jgi:imidazoleglycerol-phosphate dehydratase
MIMRAATVHRQTRETDIKITLNLDGTGTYEVETGVGFLDHMLAHVAVHGLFDLTVQASGDLHIDPHHTMEDVALTLGEVFAQALGDKAGIVRIGSAYVPMDESLALVAVDLSGRPYAVTEIDWAGPTVGGLPVTLIPHFMESFAITARANVHVRVLYGKDDHHKVEATFKALGRALDTAVRPDPRRGGAIPSTKGVL